MNEFRQSPIVSVSIAQFLTLSTIHSIHIPFPKSYDWTLTFQFDIQKKKIDRFSDEKNKNTFSSFHSRQLRKHFFKLKFTFSSKQMTIVQSQICSF